ncbi:hypothetical protein [Streptomyces erythrochromogenes]
MATTLGSSSVEILGFCQRTAASGLSPELPEVHGVEQGVHQRPPQGDWESRTDVLVTHIRRTPYSDQGQPVETAEIVVPATLCEIVYEISVSRS